ncbi:Uncharacterized protein FKW44_000505, partial [Caligus rogercresseyi]
YEEEVDRLWNIHRVRLNLPFKWKKKVESSLRGIFDNRKFTVQLQISTDCIKFYRPCKDCGYCTTPPFMRLWTAM